MAWRRRAGHCTRRSFSVREPDVIVRDQRVARGLDEGVEERRVRAAARLAVDALFGRARSA